MFSGIVEQMGQVVRVDPADFGARLGVDPSGWSHRPAGGDSIAVNGCCLTVTHAVSPGSTFEFDIIHQTLRMTTLGDLRVGDRVNLEHAVTPSTMLGGHIVQGHIDGVAVITRVDRADDEWRLRLEPPAELMDFIVDKGSIALDGVSLTVASLGDVWFEVALIPTTLERTTLGEADPGGRLNLETDYVAKTVVNWLQRQSLPTEARQ